MNLKPYFYFLASATLLPASPFIDTLLHDETFWGDGQAEYSFYDAIEIRYGTPRPTEVRYILVRESFLPGTPVKADDWRTPGTYPIVKLNQVITVPTGVYRYDQMHSSFWNAATGALRKFSLASIDSCGNTYKEGRLTDDVLAYEARTYWEGMDHVNRLIGLPKNALFTDELPFKLRLLDWDNVTEFTAPLAPSLINSQADVLEFPPATFAVTSSATEKRVTVRHATGTDIYIFEPESPYRLRSVERADGSSLTAKGGGRLDYWNQNQPGDERWIEQNTTPPAQRDSPDLPD